MSPKLLSDPTFPTWLMEQCAREAVDPHQIILEITETSSMADPVQLLEYLTQLRIKGFHLSIDDFGVGYSSLIQLARLPFSEMKIDKMFVMTAPKSQESQKIATAIVGLARALALSVTAEGLEDAWTLEFLRNIGCDVAQGYLISRPVDGDTALAWARAEGHLPPI
jgi:EAL domain-containing protein (putative c-di-GMP-specific phosphodiesterase class I)